MPQTAAPKSFPRRPESWYLFCASRQLNRKPFSRPFLGRRLVGYRTQIGRAVVMDANCAHLGADLGRGAVVGEMLRCPFHHWHYGPDGRCARIPSGKTPPASARQRVFPVEERHGYIYVHNGPRPRFAFPFFSGAKAADFVAARPFRFMADCSWYMLVSNAFDGQHFHAVHDRTLIGSPTVDCPTAGSRRMRFEAEVTGDSIFDRLLRRFAGRTVRVSLTSYGGPLVLVQASFARARSYIIVTAHPVAEHRTCVEVMAFAPRFSSRPARWLLQRLSLETRRLFTQGFMRDDFDRLRNIRYHPAALTDDDCHLRDYFAWAAELPDERWEAPCR